ncbi:MAG: glycosyltransferase family 2 protein [Candidatus Omnitrophica bacterium]|nr:glycosyltransferase family 2 protein [Candidatus Omnitrophota bacterium]
MKLSIVIPVYNEARTIEPLIRSLLALSLPVASELIIIDDHSEDATSSILERLRHTADGGRLSIIRFVTNRGRGACIREALRCATGQWLIVQDADLEYSPEDIPAMLEPILQGRTDVVYGSRFLHRKWPTGMSWRNYLANRILAWATNQLYGARLTDIMACYKLLPCELLRSMDLKADRFDFDAELTVKLLRRGCTIREHPVAYCGRSYRQGKKITPKDFWQSLALLLRSALRSA